MTLLGKLLEALMGGTPQMKAIRVAAETRKSDREKKAAKRK